MLTLVHQEQLTFHNDIRLMRSANRPGQILIDVDHTHVLLLDLARHTTKTIPFPPGVKHFAIYSWLVAPDGSASYLTSSDPRDFGLRLDHEEGTATRFHCPYAPTPLTEVCWQTPPSLQVLDYAGRVRTLDPTLGVVDTAAEVLEQEPARTYLKLHPDWTPLKAANYGQGVYAYNYEEMVIGYLPPTLSRQGALLAPREALGDEVTHYADSLFVCYGDKILQYIGDRKTTALKSPPDHFFLSIDILPVEGQPILCVLSTIDDYTGRRLGSFDQPGSFIDLYRLVPEQQQTTS